jgi:hypothetical protein
MLWTLKYAKQKHVQPLVTIKFYRFIVTMCITKHENAYVPVEWFCSYTLFLAPAQILFSPGII